MEQMSARALYENLYRTDVVVVDLRSKYLYNQGHVEGAVNIPMEKIENGTHNLPRDKEIIVYCQRGGLSSVAAKTLEKQGYYVKSVVGGMNAMKVIDIDGRGH